MNLAQHTAKIIGAPFALGGRSADQGFDCFSLVAAYLIECGLPITWDDRFRGRSLDEHLRDYRFDRDEFETAVDYLAEVLEEVDPGRTAAGDILLLELKKSGRPHFLAIDGGNGKAVTATMEKGVISIPKRFYKIERTFRSCRV